MKINRNMVNLKDVKLLIFDLDGTLFQTIGPETESVKMSLRDMGLEVDNLEEKVKGYIGKTTEESYKSLLPSDQLHRWEELEEKVLKYFNEAILKNGESFPGVIETLQALKQRGYKLALYSNAPIGYFEYVPDYLGITKFFDYAECVDENNLTKPVLINKIKTKLGELNAAVVGDRIHDIEAAKENGLISIGALYGYGKEEAEKADLTINEFSDLLKIFNIK